MIGILPSRFNSGDDHPADQWLKVADNSRAQFGEPVAVPMSDLAKSIASDRHFELMFLDGRDIRLPAHLRANRRRLKNFLARFVGLELWFSIDFGRPRAPGKIGGAAHLFRLID